MPCLPTAKYATLTYLISCCHVAECCTVSSTATTPTCAALQSLTESTQYLHCNRNDQCDAVQCNVTYSFFQSYVSMISITIMPCNLPPTVRVSGSNESGGIVFDLVTSRSQNIPLIEEVSLAISVVHLTNAIGFEVSVYAECKYVLVNVMIPLQMEVRG